MFGLNKSDTPDALDLLRSDHKEVDGLFKDFESASEGASATARRALVAQICDALSVHAKIEEEIFYPALRRASKEAADLLNEAAVEHQSLKDIIGRLRAAPTSDVLYDAGVKVLGEYVKHHVREEENDIFPKARSADIDLAALGTQLQQRKEELMGRMQRGSKRGKVSRSARGGSAESRA